MCLPSATLLELPRRSLASTFDATLRCSADHQPHCSRPASSGTRDPLDRLATIAAKSRVEAVTRSLHYAPRTNDSPSPTSRDSNTADMTPTAKSLPAWVDRIRDLLTSNMKENKDLISYALATTSADDVQQPRVSPPLSLFRSPSALQAGSSRTETDMRWGGIRSAT